NPQTFRRAIDSSRHPGWPCTGYDNVIPIVLGSGLEAQRLCDGTDRRSQQTLSTVYNHDHSVVPHRNPGGRQARLNFAVHPVVVHAIGGKETPDAPAIRGILRSNRRIREEGVSFTYCCTFESRSVIV